MAVFLELSEGEEVDTIRGGKDNGQHGENSGGSKDAGDEYETESILFGSRVHQNRNERLTGTKDKDGEENPRGQAHLIGFLVGMCMFFEVGMRV